MLIMNINTEEGESYNNNDNNNQTFIPSNWDRVLEPRRELCRLEHMGHRSPLISIKQYAFTIHISSYLIYPYFLRSSFYSSTCLMLITFTRRTGAFIGLHCLWPTINGNFLTFSLLSGLFYLARTFLLPTLSLLVLPHIQQSMTSLLYSIFVIMPLCSPIFHII